ncbi:MAG: YbhB/YbcL family Raf kinase inhibitor-like protein [bacterium]
MNWKSITGLCLVLGIFLIGFLLQGMSCQPVTVETTTTTAADPDATTTTTSGSATDATTTTTTSGGGGDATTTTTAAQSGSIVLSSSAFEDGGAIPDVHAFSLLGDQPERQDHSIPLSWTNTLTGTQSFAISMADASLDEDDTTPDINHWVVINIPAAETSVASNESETESMPGTELRNEAFGNNGYNGPWPDEIHYYIFTIYALNVETVDLSINDVIGVADLADALEGKILGQDSITGSFTP